MQNPSSCLNRHEFDAGDLEAGVEHKVVCPICGAVRKLTIEPSNGASTTRVRVSRRGKASKGEPETAEPSLPGYRIIKELGRGGFGVVYRTHDEKAGHDVALKTLLRVDSAGLRSFKDEFRSLADVGHPNIATLYDLLSDGDTWCFTMELLDAVEFHEYVWSEFACRNVGDRPTVSRMAGDGTRLDGDTLERLCDATKQFALGLNALHSAGILHRDIKHSNVMVTRDRRVVLVDFGLAAVVTSEATGTVSGTPRFMAPEQTVGGLTSPATDWYSFGVMLYEMLTGAPPFVGRPMKVMARKRAIVPPEPREVEPSVPEELNDLCMRLLSIQPEDRPDVTDVLKAVGAEEAIGSLRSAPAHRRNSSGEATQLIGREEQFAELRSQAEAVAAGGSASVFVSGRSGMGKSVLVERFLDDVRSDDRALILTGRCYQQESVPFKALDALVDSLVEWLTPLSEDELTSLLPEDSRPLPRLFPVFGQIPGIDDDFRPSVENADQQELRQRSMAALRELLSRLGQQRSLVLYIDDLQWGDVDSARLIAEVMRPPEAPQLLLLGTYRSENVGSSAFLDELDEAYSSGEHQPARVEVSVDALTPEQAAALAANLLGNDGPDTRELAVRIATESAGSPFFVWELASHAREDAEIGQRTLQLDEVIWSRVCRLAEDTRELLELVAVVARPVSANEAYQALDQVERGRNLLQQLRAANLIRTTDASRNAAETATIVESYHDRIRESVADRLDDDRARRHHLQVATVAEKLSGFTEADREQWLGPGGKDTEFNSEQRDRIFELALHFSAADCSDRAFPYALMAAELARRQDALEVAEQQFRIAESGAGDAAANIRRRIANGLGDILLYVGKYAEAEERFTLVRDLAETPLARAQATGKLGELAFKRGDMLKAATTIEAALKDIGQSVPAGLVGYLVRLSWEGTIQILHSLFPRVFTGRKPKVTDEDYVRLGLLSRLSYVNWFARGTIPTTWSHMVELNIAEQYAPSLKLAQAWSEHAAAMTMFPLHSRGIHYGQHSLRIRRERGHLWGQAQSLNFLGMALYAAARLREAYDAWIEAVTIFERAGDWWEANMSRYQSGLVAYRFGDLDEAIETSERVHQSGLRLGDDQASGIPLHVWALASDGRVPVDILHTELNRERFDFQATVQIQVAEAVRLYFADQLEDASAILDRAMQVVRRHQLRSAYVAPTYTWHIRALRTRLQRTSDDSSPDRSLLRQAKRSLRAALLFARFYRVEMPAAQFEAGELAALSGRPDKALRRFERALAEAERLEMRHQAAIVRERIEQLS